ncbi:MAG: DUF6152 family protein [Gammaproteobacteria bacterium]|nr:DUF6152 family protein [Gammaproteobacteria bacterium]
MRWGTLSLLTGSILLMAGGVQAHHSHAPFYNLDEIVEITGIVKSFRLINPHPEIVIEVTGSDGEPAEVIVYAQAYAGQMREMGGWTEDSVKIGQTVTVVGHPGRSSVSSVMGQTITTPSGDVLTMRFQDLLKPGGPPSQ